MNKLLAFADRVEKLTGPDREVDALIWCHTKGIEPRWVGTDCRLLDAGEEGIIGWIDPGKTQRNFSTNRQASGPGSIPAYTASLDAAMTLVPKNHMWSVESTGFYARVECYPGAGESAALALTCASLRARAHGGGE